MTVQAIAGFETEISGLRRGACPTLGNPMRTGDGLLARFRPADCRMTLTQLRAVAHAAGDYGNGIVEVTARGSLQVRGLQPQTVEPFEEAVLAAGIVPTSGVMVEVPPLAGMDPDELIDPRPIAEGIREIVRRHEPPLMLAPKLAIIVDGGGRFHLGSVAADVRLTAVDGQHFLLAVGGTDRSARRVAAVESERAPTAVLRVLEALASLGPTARGKDVDATGLDEPSSVTGAFVRPGDSPSFLGVQELGSASASLRPEIVLGIGLPYRQARSRDLIALLDEIEVLGLLDIRLSPGHGLLLTGLHRTEAAKAEAAARRSGFWTSASEPRAHISLCAGSLGCASASFDTRAVAEEVARYAPELLDGSLTLHLSGCRKGCAHPTASLLTLVGAPTGYGLVVNGAASDSPTLYIAANDLGIALERLASLVAGAKETGESVRDCLDKLGPARIAAALKLDGQ